MKITSIQYGRVVNLGNYEHEKLSAWSAVDEGEAPEEVMGRLMGWVDAQAGRRQEVANATAEAHNRLIALESTNFDLERQVREARQTWAKAKAFLQTVGLEVPKEYSHAGGDDEMPF